MDITQKKAKKSRSLTELAGQLSGLAVKDAESHTMQHFSLTDQPSAPYLRHFK